MIADRMPAGEPLRSNVDEILRAAERAAALVKSLMAFSRKQIINPRNVNINDCVNQLEKMLLRIIRENIEFTTVLHRAPLAAFIDAGQLEQVIINLAANARDAMPHGGRLIIETAKVWLDERFRIEHGEAACGPYVMLSVSDTGVGMDRKTQERIFEPFFTTKELGQGTGLGLSTVYGIVKQNNGFINCYSVPGKGTTFKIYLPLVTVTAEQARVEAAVEVRGGTERVLLAEDDAPLRKYTKSILEDAGYKVYETADGAAAVERFHGLPAGIDLLFLDIIMPKKDGRTVYEEIKRMKPAIKVLFTSGYTAEFVEQQGMAGDQVMILSKPCTPTDILRKVREVLDGNAVSARKIG